MAPVTRRGMDSSSSPATARSGVLFRLSCRLEELDRIPVGIFDLNLLRLLPNRWFGTMSDFTLLAIPFFIFLGAVLEKSGLAEELLETIGIMLGPMPGGIALDVVLVGTLLAATTGVVAATIIAMGMISLPIMLRLGYDRQLATGLISASGTLAQMIPPSLVLVVLSDQIGVSVGALFAGALSAHKARITEAVVRLSVARHQLRLEIADNGRGFDPGVPADGNGLASMRKRAAAFGGAFDIDSTPGHGTRVSLTASLRERPR